MSFRPVPTISLTAAVPVLHPTWDLGRLPGLLCVCQHHQAINSVLDTIYTETASDLRKWLSLMTSALTSDVNWKSRLLPELLTYGYILKVPTTLSSGPISLPDWLTGLREIFT